jgi:hypothetical protein
MMPASLLVLILIVLASFGLSIFYKCRRAHIFIWLPSYLRGNWAGKREARSPAPAGPTHILFCIADHYEPAVNNPGQAIERVRVERWVKHYPETFSRFKDADGRSPRHTFFYPAEQYNAEHVERLGELVRAGCGEVEVHLHHDGDTAAGLREALVKFTGQLRSHGHLGADPQGRPRFGFVHGNWALDNSLPDGRWCGVNGELRVLAECGCYADFTLPSAPSPAQTRRINSIYYAQDDPARSRSHDDGVEVRSGGAPAEGLMLVQGPLSILRRAGSILPRVENGNLDNRLPIAPERIAAWLRARVSVAGRPEWLFVKLYTHGCVERNLNLFFGGPMADLHTRLCEHYNDGRRYVLHYVTAREMYNVIRAAERGLAGNPGEYRDLEIGPPPCATAQSHRT